MRSSVQYCIGRYLTNVDSLTITGLGTFLEAEFHAFQHRREVYYTRRPTYTNNQIFTGNWMI